MRLSLQRYCALAFFCFYLAAKAEVEVSGELRQWHAVTLTFDGPETSESAVTNPFFDYRLNVVFSQGDRLVAVPGYYAADGNAGESGASSGGQWRVHFAPDMTGTWHYEASFRQGSGIAASLDPEAGVGVAFNGETGSFEVARSDKTGADFRGKGWLRYVGKHYPRFDNGDYFIRSGPGGPENFLGYAGFDQTPNGDHLYSPHEQDWKTGDPTWNDGAGKGIVGLINYIAEMGMNTMYFVTFNSAGGDGKDVWPWTGPTTYDRYDVSKLDQWEIVFSHMTAKGVELHLFFNEEENDLAINDGDLGLERKVYYREMISRFGHHLAVTWNLGEEINTHAYPNSEQIRSYASYIRALDPYGHPIAAHSANSLSGLFAPLLGFRDFEMATIQTIGDDLAPMHGQIIDWVSQSTAAGRPWIVTNDEQGGWRTGLPTDAQDPGHDAYRKKALWGTMMAGAGGISYYWNPDTETDDLRPWEHMWVLSTFAHDFFQTYLPFPQMIAADALTAAGDDYVFANEGYVYAIYLPDGGVADLDLSGVEGTFQVDWFDPRHGGALQPGDSTSVGAGAVVSVGPPPSAVDEDWVALLRRLDAEGNLLLGGEAPIVPGKAEGPILTESPTWIEMNGRIVIEAEKGIPETSDTWAIRDDVDDHYGAGFIRWEGPDFLNDDSHGVMRYRILVSNPGRYRLFLRSFHDPAVSGKRDDEENDCWTNDVLNSTTQLRKTFRNATLAGVPWTYRTQWTYPDDVFVDAFYEIPAGEHVFRLAARAQNFMIDRIFFVKDASTVEVGLPESPIDGVSYEDWTKWNFPSEVLAQTDLESTVWGPQADPDRDGYANGLEFFGGSDPSQRELAPTINHASSDDTLSLSMPENLLVSGATLVARVSSDLQTWIDHSAALEASLIDGSAHLTLDFPREADTAQFLRFLVEFD